jgi:formylglycine-generating enzyme required for sulfatase activity
MKHPNGPDEGALRVIRGAAYMDGLIFMRSSNRGYLSPEMAINNQGFRVVCDENPAE